MNTTSCTEINQASKSFQQTFANIFYELVFKPVSPEIRLNKDLRSVKIDHLDVMSPITDAIDCSNLPISKSNWNLSCVTLYDALPHVLSSETLCESRRPLEHTPSSSSDTLFDPSQVQMFSILDYILGDDNVCDPSFSLSSHASSVSSISSQSSHTIPLIDREDAWVFPNQVFHDPTRGMFIDPIFTSSITPIFFENQMSGFNKKKINKSKHNLKTYKSINSALITYQTRPESITEEALIRSIQKMRDLQISLARDSKKYHAMFQMNPFGPFTVGLDDKSLDALSEFTDALTNISTKIPEPKSIPGVVHSITSVLSTDFMSVLKDIPFLIAAVVTGSNFLTNPTKQNASILVVAICAYLVKFHSRESLGVPTEILSSLAKCVFKYIRPEESFENQMGDSGLNSIMEFLTFISYSYFSKTAPEGKKLEKLLKLVGDFKKTTEGCFNVAKFVIGFIEIVTNFVRTEILNLNSISILEPENKELQNHSESVRNVMDLLHKDQLVLNVANAEKIYNLWCKGNDLIGRIPSNRENSSLRTAFNTLQNQLTKIKDIFEAAHLLNTGVRMVPYTILIRGPSGVGKSAATMPLTLAFLAIVLEESNIEEFLENHNAFFYSRQHEQVYWDGYRGQFVCVYDDFGQSRDVAGVPDNEFMNLIRSSNLFPNNLHMASILEKGNTYFRSSVVVCTTNMQHVRPDSIIEPEAVQRRFNTVVDLLPPLEFCTPATLNSPGLWGRRLDVSKVNSGFDKRAVEFHDYDFKTDKHTGKVYTFDGMVAEMVRVFRSHQANHVHYSSAVEIMKREYINQRSSFVPQMDNRVPVEEIQGSQTDFKLNRFKTFYRRVHLTHEDKARLLAAMNEVLPECTFETLTLDLFGLFERDLDNFCVLLEMSNYAPHTLISKVESELMNRTGDLDLYPIVIFPESFFGKCYASLDYISVFLNNLLMKAVEVLEAYLPLSWVFNNFSTAVADAFSTWVVVVCASVGGHLIGTAVLSLFKFVCSILGFGSSIVETDLQASGTNGKGKKNRNEQLKFIRSIKEHHAHASFTPIMDAQAAFKNDSTNVQIVDKIVSRNSYEMWLPGSTSRAGIITFVRGHLAIMPWHFVMNIAEAIHDQPERAQSYIVLKKVASSIELKVPILAFLDAKQVTNFETLDVCLVDLNVANVQNHCDITPYFVPMNVATKSNDFFVRLCVPGNKGNENWCTKAAPQNNKVIGADAEDQTVIRFGYNYSAMTKVGDCGGLLTLVDPTSGMRKILGIHTAGSPSQGLGFSSAVFSEDLLDCIAMFEKQIVEEIHFDTVAQTNFVVGDGRFESLYIAPKGVNLPSKSKIMPSEVIDMWGPRKTAPAALRPVEFEGNKVDPMINALSKYCTPDVVVDPHMLDCVRVSLTDDIRSSSIVPLDPTVLTFEQAVLGLEGEDFDAISRSTSCGYPHNVSVDGRFPGKTKFFGSGPEYDLSSQACLELKERVFKILDDASNLVRNEHVFTDYLKDERRPIEKVLQAKTRLISACPLELLIAYRMYFGNYVLYCQNNCVSNGFATGVNVYSNQWQDIARNLTSIGPYMGAGDYSAFDGSEKPAIHKVILDIINGFYCSNDRDKNIRTVLWLELTNSKHINGDKIYAWFSSLPSGHPLTTLVNNHYNHICFRLVWLTVHNNDPLCLHTFRKHVYLVTLGDDNAFSVSAEKIDIFNESILEQILPCFGLKYTNETKSGATHVSRDITEITFLKRSFRYEPILDRYVAPIDMDVILEMPYWTVRGPVQNTIPCTTFETALLELSLHGENTFNTFAPPMLKAFAEKYNFYPQTSSRYVLVLKSATIKEMW